MKVAFLVQQKRNLKYPESQVRQEADQLIVTFVHKIILQEWIRLQVESKWIF